MIWIRGRGSVRLFPRAQAPRSAMGYCSKGANETWTISKEWGRTMNRIQSAALLVGLAVAATMGGCSKANDQAQPAAVADAMKPAAAHGTPGGGAGLKYTAPADWISEKPSSSMRQAQFRLPRAEGDSQDGELVVFFFQGGGGGVQANIDRWIGQFTKPDGSPANDVAKTTHKVSHGIPLTVVDVSGTYMAGSMGMGGESKPKQGFRMLAAVAEAGNGPWFFKLTGPAKTIGKWENSFQGFLDTIQ